jgi:uncharacterized protein YjbJ (UPF0337 family)
MNSDILLGRWKQLKGEVKIRWGRLTDDEIERIEGRREKLEGLLQQRYGYARHQADREVTAWLQNVQ